MSEKMDLQAQFEQLKELIQNEDIEKLRAFFLEWHPYEQAKLFSKIDKDERIQLYYYLSPEEMAPVFENLEIDEEGYDVYLSEMNPRFVADMLAKMYADDAVDILNELNKDQVASYLTIMDQQAVKEIKELLHYEEYTAGSIMTTEFIAINSNQTVQSAMNILKTKAPKAETIYYVYVIDDDKHLVGVISLRDLIIADEDTVIIDIMHDRVVSVSVADDQEEVARKMKDYDFLAVPVIDFQLHLLGIITVDDIIDVMDEEASDDYSKLAAVDVGNVNRSSFSAAKQRLPWLILLLFLGMISANLISQFEDALKKAAILTIFIPLIAGMAGNTGTQALAVAVRRIATGEIEQQSKWRLVIREAGTGIITGSICGLFVMVIIYLWQNDLFLGFLVGISILFTLTIATLSGAFVPLIMHKLGIDPAVASGPFITTINDLISIGIYFGLATLFMSYLL